MKTPYYVLLLRAILDDRKQKNSLYSLRAFALQLSVDPSQLSRLLLGKQTISVCTTKKLIERLHLNPDEARLFVDSIIEEKKLLAEEMFSSIVPSNIESECDGRR